MFNWPNVLEVQERCKDLEREVREDQALRQVQREQLQVCSRGRKMRVGHSTVRGILPQLVFALMASVLFSPALTGCSAVSAGLATPAPTAVTQPTATPLLPGATTRTVAQGGITFTYASSLAQNVQAQVQPAVPAGPDAPYWQGAPQFTRFVFNGYILSKTIQQPRIEVYPVADFRAVNPQAGKVIDALESYLAGKSLGANPGMPFLPLLNAAQTMHANPKSIKFQNGIGVRYLVQFDQGPTAINNYAMFYTYQGLTQDRKYYVAAILPVSNAILPADDQTKPAGDFKEYVAATVKKLEAQPASSYQPDLGTLDALVESLTISGK